MTLDEFKKKKDSDKFLEAMQDSELPLLIKMLEHAQYVYVIINFTEKSLEIEDEESRTFHLSLQPNGSILQQFYYTMFEDFNEKKKNFFFTLIKDKGGYCHINYYERLIDYINKLNDLSMDIILDVTDNMHKNNFKFNYYFDYHCIKLKLILIEKTDFSEETYFSIPFHLNNVEQGKETYNLFKDRIKNFYTIRTLKGCKYG